MCPASVQVLREAEKANKVFDSIQDCETSLIEPMNKIFGSDVFYIRGTKAEMKYVKIGCKMKGCPFDIWLNYSLNMNKEITKLSVFRYIIQGHACDPHALDFQKRHPQLDYSQWSKLD